jgi:signal transduction histidine kinase
VSDLNRSKGTNFVAGLGMVMLLVLGGGLFGIYNLTSTQIKASKKRQDFISAVSHELKTPLTSIRMYGEMLENGWVVSQERTQHYYRLIASEAERLSRLIQNVLNLSALEKKQWMVNMQPSNPRLFFEDFIAKYRATVERAGFEMDVQMDDFTLDILIDPDACFQILMNITENSLKFSKDFLPKKIDFELRVFPDSLVLSIRDYGPGIPPSEMTKVFDDFYRIENEMIRKTSGTGIGLSLVRHLCNAMNIRVEISNANPGLKSEIRFPTLKL